jgi:type I restriction enzyme R subunit
MFVEQWTFTDGRIVVTGRNVARKPQKRADYILRYSRDVALAVVEAKANYKYPGLGLQQAKDYAEILGLKFAYSTNGHGIVEFDYFTGRERELKEFPSPDALWERFEKGNALRDGVGRGLLAPGYRVPGKPLRYYQEIAVNRVIKAILEGQPRVLVTMATGTGKTLVAFQVCWKLWSARWNRTGEYRRPRILYLADRNILIDDPKDKIFTAFGDARWKIENGVANKGREIYFAIYQAISRDERRPGLYREYPPEFFDLIIVDECHRGSAADESNWREILEYFHPAYQFGMTATPLREDNRDTYKYFGNPVYQYSLRQGVEDGFLAPYRVHRVLTDYDATGWRPSAGDLDRFGRVIPDRQYNTSDFERVVALKARTEAIARHITAYLKSTERFAKTIVFCVDQEHADEMRRALTNMNSDLVQQFPDYVVRITSDEGEIGRGHLYRFQDVETRTPTIATTSHLLSTGVDVPTCHNVAIVRVVGSMTEFKQIIGRGTRIRDDYGKYFFTILDYTGSATRLFADPEFDGEPALVTQEEIDADGARKKYQVVQAGEYPVDKDAEESRKTAEHPAWPQARKYYFDGGQVEIVAHLVYELDPNGKQLRVVRLADYAAEQIRTLFRSGAELRAGWADPIGRNEIIARLEERGISFEQLAEVTRQIDADPFDLICHLAFAAPLRTRRERADRVRRDEAAFFDRYQPEARKILDELLEKYAVHGTAQFLVPDILKVPPISDRGNVMEIARLFTGPDHLRQAVEQLQNLIYAA